MHNRRRIRIGLKVSHRHLVAGGCAQRQVSELIFIKGAPKAVLGWIDLGGMRTPICFCDLDPAKLTRSTSRKNVYFYSGITIDPRYENVVPARPPQGLFAP
jgi:hypothetical protein